MLKFEILETKNETTLAPDGRMLQELWGEFLSKTHIINMGRAETETLAKYPVPEGWRRDSIHFDYFSGDEHLTDGRKTFMLFRIVNRRIEDVEQKVPSLK